MAQGNPPEPATPFVFAPETEQLFGNTPVNPPGNWFVPLTHFSGSNLLDLTVPDQPVIAAGKGGFYTWSADIQALTTLDAGALVAFDMATAVFSVGTSYTSADGVTSNWGTFTAMASLVEMVDGAPLFAAYAYKNSFSTDFFADVMITRWF